MVGHYLFNFTRSGSAKGRSMREQAAELLNEKLWGIGEKAPNRRSLGPGDRVLIYVGVPESAFIAHAELDSNAHVWTPEEAARYPADMVGGVAIREAEVWPHPVSMKTVISQLNLFETNPQGRFFSGVARITQRDYELVVAAGTGAQPRRDTTPSALAAIPTTPAPMAHPVSATDIDLLFKTAERLKKVGKLSTSLSEYDTRAEFIDKYLEALGYTELGDIQRGAPVDSGNFPDYVLLVNDVPAIAIEAKKLGAPLGSREAAQVAGYCTNLGVRWGVVTDGRQFMLYDAPMLGVPPDERRVFSVDLADYRDWDDFEARIYPMLELIAKSELASGAGLERTVAVRAIREVLTTSSSKTARALRRELDETKRIRLSPSELSDIVSEMLG
jgi:Type I restriction enzyme R protein N terminus (HSDR_N)